MKTNEAGVSLCDGTDCEALTVGSCDELKEVPRWRHPGDRKQDRVFEVVRRVSYCAKHEMDAKAALVSVLPC
jgi:hypothetical protein